MPDKGRVGKNGRKNNGETSGVEQILRLKGGGTCLVVAVQKKNWICLAAELEVLKRLESHPWKKGWRCSTVVLRMMLAQTRSKCFVRAGHNSRARFCACKMRKTGRNQSL